jgi:hypothetical protein
VRMLACTSCLSTTTGTLACTPAWSHSPAGTHREEAWSWAVVQMPCQQQQQSAAETGTARSMDRASPLHHTLAY